MDAGRITIEVENAADVEGVRRGLFPADAVRRRAAEAVVDQTVVIPVFPEDLVDALGLTPMEGLLGVRAGVVTIRLAGRETAMSVTIGPRGAPVRLGRVLLHSLRMERDRSGQGLVPCADSTDRPHFRI